MDTQTLLDLIDKSSDPLNTYNLSKSLNIDHQTIIGALKSLQSSGSENFLNVSQPAADKVYSLSKEANEIIEQGSHEFRLLKLIPDEGISQPDLMKAAGSCGKIGFSKAMQAKWIKMDKPTKMVTRTVSCEDIVDECEMFLKMDVFRFFKFWEFSNFS